MAPEKIENIYLRSRLVGQVLVHGESLKSTLIGVVVPDPDVSLILHDIVKTSSFVIVLSSKQIVMLFSLH